MRITTKIWLSLAVLATGYLATVVVDGIMTRWNEKRLTHVATGLFPGAVSTQEALATFRIQAQQYQDAVVLGDSDVLAAAKVSSLAVLKHLEITPALSSLDPQRIKEISGIRSEILSLADDAEAVYHPMASGTITQELSDQAALLKARTTATMNNLEQVVLGLRTDLRSSIDSINAATVQQRAFNETAFVIIASLAALFIAVITREWSSRLSSLLLASRTLADGHYDSKVTGAGNDEVGQLASSFEQMRLAIRQRNHDLRQFNDTLELQVKERTNELEKKNSALGEQIAERRRAELSLRLLDEAVGQLSEAVVITDPLHGTELPLIRFSNPSFATLCGNTALPQESATIAALFLPLSIPPAVRAGFSKAAVGEASTIEVHIPRTHGECILDWHFAPIRDEAGGNVGTASVIRDVTQARIRDAQHSQGQKLESIGQLAAGVAHEINTPIQFVGDNLRFMGDSFSDLSEFLVCATALRATVTDGEAAQAYDAAYSKADVEYLCEEMPKAAKQGLEGVERVATIISALKEFAHPDNGTMQSVDLRRAIDSTLNVARSEYKYVADLAVDFDPRLPLVECVVGEINQVVLNLVVNASHAIADAIKERGGRGTITVAVQGKGDRVEIRISDTGTGIPEHARAKIFDPFFTTKEVGKGTGQGLFIAHEVIVKKHHGALTMQTEMGVGTTFLIALPLCQTSKVA